MFWKVPNSGFTYGVSQSSIWGNMVFTGASKTGLNTAIPQSYQVKIKHSLQEYKYYSTVGPQVRNRCAHRLKAKGFFGRIKAVIWRAKFGNSGLTRWPAKWLNFLPICAGDFTGKKNKKRAQAFNLPLKLMRSGMKS